MQQDIRSERIKRLRQFFLSDQRTFTASELVQVLMRSQSSVLTRIGDSILKPGDEAEAETCISREDAYFLVYESTPIEILQEAMGGIEPKWMDPSRQVERLEIALPKYILDFMGRELARLRSLKGLEGAVESVGDAIHSILLEEFFERGGTPPPHAIRPLYVSTTAQPDASVLRKP